MGRRKGSAEPDQAWRFVRRSIVDEVDCVDRIDPVPNGAGFVHLVHVAVRCMLMCKRWRMRTNVVLDDELVEEARKLTGIKTKRELVNEALRVLIATRRRKSLLEIMGKIEFAPGYDYKEHRRDRS